MRTWNRPMTVFAALMGVLALVSIGGLIFDDRILLGAPIWLKPFKFAVSIGIYCVTWAWLTSMLTRGRRLAAGASAVIVALLAVEYVILVTQVVRGRASHFNVATPLDSALYNIMGASIAVVWIATLGLTVMLFRTPVADAAQRSAIRLGTVISLVGIALGILMVLPRQGQPTAQQLVGAHSVGVEDGGPGMPVTGWSTIGGDLRIPHFVGMHALQALPLFLLLLGLLSHRFPRLRSAEIRSRLVLIAGADYAGLLALLTWQALRGQSLIHPDAVTLSALAVLLGAAAFSATLVIREPKVLVAG